MAAVTTRPAQREDMPRLLEIEKGAIPTLQYLKGVEDIFFDYSNGELVVAEIDSAPAGFGRFTVQPDGSGWLETLRVEPQFQKMGCGRAIWERWMELVKQFGVTALRMYTTFENEGSKKLAYNHKLDIAIHTREYSLPLAGVAAPAETGFSLVTDEDEADSALLPYVYDYRGYYITNRTFYAANPATTRWLAGDGKVFSKEGSALVCGSRYLHSSALHFGLMGGDLEACIAFAVAEGVKRGLPKVVTMIEKDDAVRAAALEAAGFTVSPSQIIMMERLL